MAPALDAADAPILGRAPVAACAREQRCRPKHTAMPAGCLSGVLCFAFVKLRLFQNTSSPILEVWMTSEKKPSLHRTTACLFLPGDPHRAPYWTSSKRLQEWNLTSIRNKPSFPCKNWASLLKQVDSFSFTCHFLEGQTSGRHLKEA